MIPTLIAALLTPDDTLHAARYCNALGTGWCGAAIINKGTHYVPAWAFDGRAKYGDVSMCAKCGAALRDLAESP